MQLPPLPPPPGPLPGPFDFLVDLVDAKWAITTVIALYGAIASTFNAFIKEWWLHRPRIKVVLYESVQVGNGQRVEMLSVNVINRGYQARRMHPSVSFEIHEMRKSWLRRLYGRVFHRYEGHPAIMVTQPGYIPAAPERLEPTDSYQAFFLRRLAVDAAREHRLTGKFHVRVFVLDGINERYDSNWVELEVGA